MLPLRNPHNKQYILSLDSLDLSLLSQYIQKSNDEKRMLWSKPFLDGEASYHQVELITEEFQDEVIDFDDRETCICHICNIDVPRKYYEEHAKSKKHLTYNKLAAKFMENVAKQLNTNFDNDKNNKYHDEFYCETCSKVVSLKQKRQHEDSDYHLKSIENDKLINSFLKMYLGNKTNENVSNIKDKTVSEEYYSFSDNDAFSECSIENAVAKPRNDILNLKNATHIMTDHFTKHKANKEDVTSIIPQTNVSDASRDTTMDLIKMIVEKCNSNLVMPIMENNYVTIVSPNGNDKKITIWSYFGYRKCLWFVYCQLCKIDVEPADLIQHIATELHLRNVLQPVNNYFAREMINKDEFSSQSQSHCLLCNEIVFNSSDHATKMHLIIDQTTMLNTNENLIKPKTKYCLVCDKSIDIKIFLEHTNNRKHRRSSKKLMKNEPNAVEEKKTAESNSILKGPKKTFCDVCNVSIDSHNFLGHTESAKHKKKTKTKMNTPSISNVKVTSHTDLFCDICKVKVPSGGMGIHIAGKPHKLKENLTKISHALSNNLPK